MFARLDLGDLVHASVGSLMASRKPRRIVPPLREMVRPRLVVDAVRRSAGTPSGCAPSGSACCWGRESRSSASDPRLPSAYFRRCRRRSIFGGSVFTRLGRSRRGVARRSPRPRPVFSFGNGGAAYSPTLHSPSKTFAGASPTAISRSIDSTRPRARLSGWDRDEQHCRADPRGNAWLAGA